MKEILYTDFLWQKPKRRGLRLQKKESMFQAPSVLQGCVTSSPPLNRCPASLLSQGLMANIIGGQLRSLVVGWNKLGDDERIAETVGTLIS